MIKYLIILIILSSCYTQKKAEEQTDKAHDKYPAMVAKKTRSWFPCVKVKADTAYRTDTLYDLVEVRCPDTIAYRVDSFETVTAVKVPVYIKVPIAAPIQTITVTNTVEDSAKIFIMSDQITKCSDSLTAAQNKISHRGKVIKWLIFFLVGLAVPYIIKIVKLFL